LTANGERRTNFFSADLNIFSEVSTGHSGDFPQNEKIFPQLRFPKKILSSPLAFREMRPYIDTTSRRMLHGRC